MSVPFRSKSHPVQHSMGLSASNTHPKLLQSECLKTYHATSINILAVLSRNVACGEYGLSFPAELLPYRLLGVLVFCFPAKLLGVCIRGSITVGNVASSKRFVAAAQMGNVIP